VQLDRDGRAAGDPGERDGEAATQRRRVEPARELAQLVEADGELVARRGEERGGRLRV
jgi:hypothetical protein